MVGHLIKLPSRCCAGCGWVGMVGHLIKLPSRCCAGCGFFDLHAMALLRRPVQQQLELDLRALLCRRIFVLLLARVPSFLNPSEAHSSSLHWIGILPPTCLWHCVHSFIELAYSLARACGIGLAYFLAHAWSTGLAHSLARAYGMGLAYSLA
eukprot:780909-Pelagomonas_calceolata.AAC.1